MLKTDEQKKALKPLLFGIGLVVLIVGAISDLYETQVGLVIALAIWILTVPALKVLGYSVDESESSKKDESGKSKSTQGTTFWKLALIVIVGGIVAIWGISFIFGQQLGVRGSGVVTTEDREVSNFSSVELRGAGNLDIKQTGEETLSVEAEDNLIDRIETSVEGETLIIQIKNPWFFWSFWPTKEINYSLSVDDLEKVSISGSGSAKADKLSADDFEINISGSGNVDLTLDVKNLDIDISGSGKVILDGTSTKNDLNISGSGKYDAQNLSSETVKINISGSGESIVNAKKLLDVKISGSGKVQYLGSPDIDQDISGSGSIKRLKD